MSCTFSQEHLEIIDVPRRGDIAALYGLRVALREVEKCALTRQVFIVGFLFPRTKVDAFVVDGVAGRLASLERAGFSILRGREWVRAELDLEAATPVPVDHIDPVFWTRNILKLLTFLL